MWRLTWSEASKSRVRSNPTRPHGTQRHAASAWERAIKQPGLYTGVVVAPNSTLEGITTPGPAGQWFGRVALLVLAVVVVAGGTGWLGVKTFTAEGSGDGYALRLDYPRIARAGLDIEWRATVTHEGGFPGDTVTLAITGDYFDIYETQGFFPDPSSTTRSADTLYLTFDAPEGDTLVVDYDAYIQPSSQVGNDGVLAVMDDGSRVAQLSFSTWLAP
jgi:hypothetical protein